MRIFILRRADERVLACADDLNASLVVIGTRRRRMRERTTLGTTTERLLAFATSPVLMVPSSDDEMPSRGPLRGHL